MFPHAGQNIKSSRLHSPAGSGQSEFLTVYGGLELALGIAFLCRCIAQPKLLNPLFLCLLVHGCLVAFGQQDLSSTVEFPRRRISSQRGMAHLYRSRRLVLEEVMECLPLSLIAAYFFACSHLAKNAMICPLRDRRTYRCCKPACDACGPSLPRLGPRVRAPSSSRQIACSPLRDVRVPIRRTAARVELSCWGRCAAGASRYPVVSIVPK